MLKKIIPTSLTAGLIALGISFTGTSTAQAGSLSFSYSNGHGAIYYNELPRYSSKRVYKHKYLCVPGKAVRKAKRFGVRKARIDRVGRKFIIVKGRKRGKRVEVAFERRSPRCEVAWIERKRRKNHNIGYHYHQDAYGLYGHSHAHKPHKRSSY